MKTLVAFCKTAFRKQNICLWLLALPMLLVLCQSCEPKKKVRSNTIIVSIEPLRYITEYLVRGNFEVKTLTPRESTPESYAPTVQQIQELEECAAFVRVGSLGFEKTQIQKTSNSLPHLYMINAGEKTKTLPMCEHGGHSDHHEGEDPHIWMSPWNMKIMALNIYKSLCHIDSSNAEDYKKRLLEFSAEMNELDSLTRLQLDTLDSRSFLINHPALGHFACQYNLNQISLEHDGKDPSPRRLNELIQLCRDKGVKKAFVQRQHSDKAVQAVAKELGLQVYTIDPLTYDWKEEMKRIANFMAE